LSNPLLVLNTMYAVQYNKLIPKITNFSLHSIWSSV